MHALCRLQAAPSRLRSRRVQAAAMAAAAAPAMPYQTLGRSGLLVSRLSFGSWVTFSNQVGTDDAYSLMKTAYAAGVNLYDNAEAYASGKSEEIMGEAVKLGEKDGVWQRSDLVITTKLFFGTRTGLNTRGLSRKHIIEGCQASLKRMQLDYVDVLFCHRPDPITPLEEVVRAMNFCIEQGWAFYWGTSEWSGVMLAEAIGICDRLGLIRPVVEQPEYNVFARQRVEVEYDPVYRLSGMGLTVWSPLASGILTGKYSGKKVPEGSRLALDSYKFLLTDKFGPNAWQVDAADELAPIAAELECTPAQLALAWCLLNPRVSTVILGATSVAQLKENLGALAVLPKLTPAIKERVEAIGGGKGKPAFHSSWTQVTGIRETDKHAYSRGF